MVDYSKWNNIEISDDEDGEWPKINRVSLSQENLQAQVEKMEEQKKTFEDYQRRKADYQKSMSETKEKILELQQVLKELEEQNENNEKLGDELMKKKKISPPWNVDTISQPGFSKTMINTRSSNENSSKKDETRKNSFIIEHKKELEYYGMLCNYTESKAYLRAHDYLLCDDAVIYLLLWSIQLDIEQKRDLRNRVLHQGSCLYYILNIGIYFKCDPRVYLDKFFDRIQDPVNRLRFEETLELLKLDIVSNVYSEIQKEVVGLRAVSTAYP